MTPAAKANATRRLFFALWPDEPTRRQLVRETRRVVHHCGGKPVPPAHYHVTLAFIGNLPAERFDDIVAAGRATAAAQLELLFDRVGYWSRPRVLWAAPSRCPPALHALVSMLWDRLCAVGLEPEARAYQPHLTLCRKVGRAGSRQSWPSRCPGAPLASFWWSPSSSMADLATGSSSGFRNSGDFPQPSALIEMGQSGLPERGGGSLVA